MIFSQEDIKAFQEMAASFAAKSVQPLLGRDSPDGDLSCVRGVLAEARDNGLIASPDPESPGFETGVWGKFAVDMGPRVSLLLLEELAVACGGVAHIVHVWGLGSLVGNLALQRPEMPEETVVALFEGGFPFSAQVLRYPESRSPAEVRTVVERVKDEVILKGRKDFVYQPADTRAYIVFARDGNEWRAFLVDAETEGLKREDAGKVMGLRAASLVHLVFKDVKISGDRELQFGCPGYEPVLQYVRFYWLGVLAVAAGVARGALRMAEQYAHERYQCCTEIINHPAVGALLLAEAESRINACRSLLDHASAGSGDSFQDLSVAAQAKLVGMDLASRAVTDSLQVFGGYGYMEDYGMEKRYRDINTLKSVGGGARDMKTVVAGFREVL